MAKLPELRDCNGIRVGPGDTVSLVRVPPELLDGLPAEDQIAINSQVGKTLVIFGFDDHGLAEIEFLDAEGNPHTIWIETDCLSRK
jgi:hypothetical protein